MTLAEFLDRAAAARRNPKRTLVPVWREVLLDTETPVSAFHKLRADGGPFAFLLESAPAGSETWARYTFMGSAPWSAWRLIDGVVEDWTPANGWHNARRPKDPLADLETLLTENTPMEIPEAGDFWHGAVGYFSYDIVRLIEKLPNPPARTLPTPDALFVFTDALVLMDNLRAHARVVVGVPVDASMHEEAIEKDYKRAMAEIDATIARLRAPGTLPPIDMDKTATPAEGTSNYAPEKFKADVQRIRDYIVAGDAFQVLLARRIQVPFDFSSET